MNGNDDSSELRRGGERAVLVALKPKREALRSDSRALVGRLWGFFCACVAPLAAVDRERCQS